MQKQIQTIAATYFIVIKMLNKRIKIINYIFSISINMNNSEKLQSEYSVKSKYISKVKEALRRNNYSTQQEFAREARLSRGTVNKFFTGKCIKYDNFTEICKLLDLEWEEIINTENKVDLTIAPDLLGFYGRSEELTDLKYKLFNQTRPIKLIGLFGIGGIGKSCLARRLVEDITLEFDYVIWLSLREATSINVILKDIIKFISDYKENDLLNSIEKSIDLMIRYLKKSRCLIILDNAESILSPNYAGRFQEEYQQYEAFLEKFSTLQHQSCLLITSREKPNIFVSNHNAVHSISLRGLKTTEAKNLITVNQNNEEINKLIELYEGHPLALKLVNNIIEESDYQIQNFIEDMDGRPVFFDALTQVLDWHFQRLHEAGKEVMYWLAINREYVSSTILKEDIITNNKRAIIETIDYLRKRCLIEIIHGEYTLQNV